MSMQIKFIPAFKYPQEEGQYLWRSCFGQISLVHVHHYKGELVGEWYGISDFGGRNVEAFGIEAFSEKVEFVFDY